MPVDDGEVRELVGRVDQSLERIESLPDSPARVTAADALSGLLELYGEGFSRVVALVARRGGPDMMRAFADDELLSHLLLLHGLHPVDVETRVQEALDSVSPALSSHGGSVELLGIDQGVVHLRLEGSCDGCPSSALTLKSTIEEAILKAAPDVIRVEAEGASEAPSRPDGAFIPISALRVREKMPVMQPVTSGAMG